MEELLCKELVAKTDHAVLVEELRPQLTTPTAKTDILRIEPVMDSAAGSPPLPVKIKDTGLSTKFLNALLLKSLHILGLETNIEIAAQLKLSQVVVDHLLSSLKQQGLVEVRGASPTGVSILRYALTNGGKQFAIEAGKQCEYVGPAPVSLAAFQAQVQKQSLRKERITLNDLANGLSHLILPDRLFQRLGPAVNSGRALLIYGPPGNGKTTISEAVGKLFRHPVHIPYCVEVAGQVIRVFDPTVHSEIEPPAGNNGDSPSLLRKLPDPRWVKCKRPVILMGGELTLDMLDLRYDSTSRFYEAPPQMKALGGVCIIDDFGRQRMQPCELLNRWIVPLEKCVDYLTVHTGRKFDIPFDELVIFSTNIPPLQLMDAAQLRRVKYKIRVEPPSQADYTLIFKRICRQNGLDLPESILTFLLHDFYPASGIAYAGYHPVFFVEHALAACRYRGLPPQLTIDLVKEALEDLFITEDAAHDLDNRPISLVRTPKVS